MKPLFPMFLKLDQRPCLVVGAGKVGEGKIRSLLDSGALVRVVGREADPAVIEWSRSGEIVLRQRAFTPDDLSGVFLAVVATSSPDLNQAVFREAQRRGVLCNVVDVPEQCDFYYPAVMRRGHLQIAISTGGRSPALARRLRRQLEQQFGPGYAAWVEELGETRRHVLMSNLDPELKRDLLHSLAGRQALEAMLAATPNRKGEPE